MLFVLLSDGVGRRPGVRARRRGRLARTPASSAAWVRSTGRWPPRSVTRCTCRSRCGASSRTRDGVTVRADGLTVRARRVIVAVPLAIASQILYEPMLPVDRSFLHQRMPSGAIYKINIVYDEPFWRDDGLSGQSAAPGSPATITIDACTDSRRARGAVRDRRRSRSRARLTDARRRRAPTERVLDELVGRFGDKARRRSTTSSRTGPTERYSGGGMLSHAPPGVLTEFGPALREPCGRIHWAGTESSAVMCGWVDGAVRSGERASDQRSGWRADAGTRAAVTGIPQVSGPARVALTTVNTSAQWPRRAS